MRIDECAAGDEKKSIRLKMKYLFTDDALEKYSWRGTEKKKSFKQLKAVNAIIYQSVRDQFRKYRMEQYKGYMVQWLKLSKTRQRTVTYSYPARRNETESSDEVDDEYEDEDR